MNAPLEAARKKVNALLRRNFSCEDAPADEFEGEDVEIAREAVLAFLEATAPEGTFKPGGSAFNLGGSTVLRHLKRLAQGE